MADYSTSTPLTTDTGAVYGLVGVDNTNNPILFDPSSVGGGTLTFTAPTGFSVVGSPLTGTGTISLGFSAGYSLPTTASQTNWDTAFGWGDHAAAGYLLASTASTTYQPLDSDLTAIGALIGTAGLLRKTAANTWTLDTTTYGTGTVSSVGLVVPTGFSVSGSPVTSSGNLTLNFAAGYALPTTASQTNWDTAYGWGDHAVAGYLDAADIGSTVLAYDANLQAFTTAFTLPTTDGTVGQVLGTDGAGNLTFTFPAPGPVQSVTYNDGGTSTINAADGGNSIFALTANGASTTIAVSNVPSSGTRYGLELHLTWTAGAITFPASWSKGDTLPSATGNYVITAVTIDGGTSFKIAVLTE